VFEVGRPSDVSPQSSAASSTSTVGVDGAGNGAAAATIYGGNNSYCVHRVDPSLPL
jgi:hypothetical protein